MRPAEAHEGALATAVPATLRRTCEPGTLLVTEDTDATQLILYEIHDELIEQEDGDEEAEEDA